MGIFASGQRLTAAQLNALGNSAYTSTAALSGTTTCASASYINLPTGGSLANFVKYRTDTALIVHMRINWFSTAVNTFVTFGVQIGGVDYDAEGGVTTEANSWQAGKASARIPAGIAAGSYTVQGRWLRAGGAGTLTANDWFSLLVVEAQ